jgi:thiosulfate dehydrogenase
MKSTVAAAVLCLSLFAACGDREVPAAELGQERFADPKVSTSRFNSFSCATCHAVDPQAGPVVAGRLDPGYNLAGAATRGSWWGGGETSLLDAINVCVREFMGGRTLTRDEDTARELDAYLEAHPSTAAGGPAPFTVVRVVGPLADVAGDATRGGDAYHQACARCHGAVHTSAGHLAGVGVKIPDETVATFPGQGRDVTVEKVRHGRFFNVGGLMPFYSAEALSNQTLADIMAYMGL